MKNIKFIDKSKYPKCWTCNGLGKINNKKCETCKGTKKFREDNFMLIYTDKNGLKQAFNVDGLK